MTEYNIDVREWIRFALMDFDVALNEAKRYRPPIEIICYHCQQAAEKMLKAYTIAQKSALKKTHDLETLIEECKQFSPDFSNIKSNCVMLSSYVSGARYPSEIELTEYEMKQAIKNAQQVLDFTKSKLKELGHEYKEEL
ncbi:MAG: HEPN domain-containing protein [Chitinispirillales bacterium]|jgi:HEPN domain-containing protein|nr:HEPN domain-containing protein [Chitinispirillales bacterium]